MVSHAVAAIMAIFVAHLVAFAALELPAATAAAAVLSLLFGARFLRMVRRGAGRLRQVEPAAVAQPSRSVAVVVPMFNEAQNAADCVAAVLGSTSKQQLAVQLVVVDDGSSDGTLAILSELQQRLHARGEDRFTVASAPPREPGSNAVGKSMAAAHGADVALRTRVDFLVFIDADCRVKPGGLAALAAAAVAEEADLLSCIPELRCGCLAEWLVQPLIGAAGTVSFDPVKVNDPVSKRVFAAGPCMCFAAAAYQQLGGHRAVAHHVVVRAERACTLTLALAAQCFFSFLSFCPPPFFPQEDVELARLVKERPGLRLRLLGGRVVLSIWMYRDFFQLWEGWTKNLYLGARGMPPGFYWVGCVSTWLVFVVPSLALATALAGIASGWLGGGGGGGGGQQLWLAAALASAVAFWQLRQVRLQLARETGIPPYLWWSAGLGGLILLGLQLASAFKTLTGIGWTWRGRSLARPATSASKSGAH
jgi:glycosyltransferase involved in cell wall biosynthesis